MSPVLITKILMGTLGFVPAYDRFFQDGVATYKVTTREYSPESVPQGRGLLQGAQRPLGGSAARLRG